ncbi:MAG TPA: ABC transporter permease subunit [Casimicrobiaceae bacterium]|jgi:dipeptide transport system permease protein|nr:ABC transporter permease subunit [Casimicrobiaceae bacterium]
MLRFVLRRLALIIPTFFGVTLLAFALIHLIPGDPVENLSGERGMDPARRARLLHQFGLDQPLPLQYVRYIGQVLRGDLGESLTTHDSVAREFATLFPATVELAFFALAFALVVGLPAGVLAAVKRNTVADYAVMGVSLTGYSMPIFWWALLLILFFSVQLGITPVSGRIAVQYDVPAVTGLMLVDALLAGDMGAFRSALSHLVLPTIALGTIPLAVISRMTRSAMLEVLRDDFVRAARAKGLPRWRVIVVHALRNALIPVVTVVGLQVGLLLSGAILTETIFSWPGIGNWLIHGVQSRDYPVVQGGILLIAGIVIAVNLVVDLLYGVVNPRIRHA